MGQTTSVCTWTYDKLNKVHTAHIKILQFFNRWFFTSRQYINNNSITKIRKTPADFYWRPGAKNFAKNLAKSSTTPNLFVLSGTWLHRSISKDDTFHTVYISLHHKHYSNICMGILSWLHLSYLMSRLVQICCGPCMLHIYFTKVQSKCTEFLIQLQFTAGISFCDGMFTAL